MDNEDPKKAETPDDFVSRTLDLYKSTKNAWEDIHDNYIDDTKFAAGAQWDEKVKTQRTNSNLSCLVYNKVASLIKYIVNNSLSNTPAIKCAPVTEGATENTARIFDGLIKYIEHQSNSQSVYSTALRHVATGGIGAWSVEITEEDIDDDGDDDVLLTIERILDPRTLMPDPSASKVDRSDARYWFREKFISKHEFEERWPGKTVPKNAHSAGLKKKDQVKVIEYWCRKETETSKAQICIYMLSESELLEVNESYLGKHFPFVFVTGQEVITDDDIDYRGCVRDIRDMQMFLNLAESKTADELARNSDAKYFVKLQQMQAFMDLYSKMNMNGIPFLPYDGDTPPVPVQQAQANTYLEVSSKVDADIRAAVGIRDPLKDIPATQSGKAIALQISQSDIGTFEFVNAVNVGVKRTGEILVDLIPKYYGYEHVRQIMGLDQQITSVPLNLKFVDEMGNEIMHDLSAGKYSVTLSTGQSYESQRSEASDKLMEIAKTYPQFLGLAGDILFRNFNFNGASEIADRLRTQVPPEALNASTANTTDPRQMIQMLQAQLNQFSMQMQQLNQQNQQLQQQNTQLTTDLQNQISVTQLRNQNDIQLKQMDTEGKLQLEKVKQEGSSDQIHEKGLVQAQLAELDSDLMQEQHRTQTHANIFLDSMRRSTNPGI